MKVSDLKKPLLDLIPEDYKLGIERDVNSTLLTLRHDNRFQQCRIYPDQKVTEVNLKAAIIFMVEQMKKEETL